MTSPPPWQANVLDTLLGAPWTVDLPAAPVAVKAILNAISEEIAEIDSESPIFLAGSSGHAELPEVLSSASEARWQALGVLLGRLAAADPSSTLVYEIGRRWARSRLPGWESTPFSGAPTRPARVA